MRKIKKNRAIRLKPRDIQELFTIVTINTDQNNNFFIKPAQLLMEFKEIAMKQTENEDYFEDRKLKSLYLKIEKESSRFAESLVSSRYESTTSFHLPEYYVTWCHVYCWNSPTYKGMAPKIIQLRYPRMTQAHRFFL